jgi:hypothetical protein
MSSKQPDQFTPEVMPPFTGSAGDSLTIRAPCVVTSRDLAVHGPASWKARGGSSR